MLLSSKRRGRQSRKDRRNGSEGIIPEKNLLDMFPVRNSSQAMETVLLTENDLENINARNNMKNRKNPKGSNWLSSGQSSRAEGASHSQICTVDDISGRVAIVSYRYTSKLGRRIMARFGQETTYRTRLDKYGSIVWNLIDGIHSVRDIQIQVSKELGEDVAEINRLSKFLGMLEEREFIEYR